MSCEACQAAQNNPHSGLYHAGCDGCAARSLAKSMIYRESVLIKKFSPAYLKALQVTFGDDWRRGHDLVKKEAERLEGMV